MHIYVCGRDQSVAATRNLFEGSDDADETEEEHQMEEEHHMEEEGSESPHAMMNETEDESSGATEADNGEDYFQALMSGALYHLSDEASPQAPASSSSLTILDSGLTFDHERIL